MDIEEPLKRIANPANLVDRIESIKYAISDGASQYSNQLDEISKIVGEQTVERINLQEEGNMPADLVNVDWWLPLNLASDDMTSVSSMAYDGDEYIYVGGTFQRIGGIEASNIARYSLVTRNWEEVGGGVNNSVRVVAIDSTGGVYIGGDFTDASGVAAADYLAILSGSSWTNVVSSITGTRVNAIEFDSTGGVYVGGVFTSVAGSTNGTNIFKIDSSTVEFLSAGVSVSVRAIAFSPDDSIVYVGGGFTNAGGVAEADYLAKWESGAWGAVSTDIVLSDEVHSIAVSGDGSVYVAGVFTSANGNANTQGIFKWDGTSVSSLGNGVNTNEVFVVKISSDNNIYIGGSFGNAGNVSDTARIAVFFGDEWHALSNGGGISTNSVSDILLLDSGSVIAGGTFNYAGSVNCQSIAICVKPLSEAIDIISSLFELYSESVIENEGWHSFSPTWVYASASSFTITGDYTNIFTKDTRLSFTQPTLGQKYAVVVNSSYSDPNTTVTILVNTDYTLANEAFGNKLISHEMSPAGYPMQFNFSPTYTNVTVGNGTSKGEIQVGGGFVEGWASLEWLPTSDTPTSAVTGSLNLTMPVAPSTDLVIRSDLGGATIFDDNTAVAYKGISVYTGSSTIQLRVLNASATYATQATANATVPITWAGSDYFIMMFRYPY